MSTLQLPETVPSGSELRGYLAEIKRLQDHRSWLRRLYDGSDSLFGALLLAGFVVQSVRSAVDTPRAAAELAGAATTQWLVLLLAIGLAAVTFTAALSVGPVFAGMATQHWVLGSPVDRRQLLLRRWVSTLLAGAVGGTVCGGLLTLLRPGWLPNLPVAFAVGAAAGLSTVAFASWCQPVRARVRSAHRVTLTLLGGLAVVAAGCTVLEAVGSPLAAPAVSLSWLAMLLGVLAVVSTVLGYRELPSLHRGALSAGTEFADAAVAATSLLEPSMLSHALTQRRWRRIGRVRPVSLRGTATVALLRAELARLRRRPAVLAASVALLLVPYLAALLLEPSLTAPAQAFAAFLVADRLASGLRTICRSPALRRTIGGSDTALRTVHLVLPAAGAVLFCALTAPALPAGVLYCAPVSAAGAVLVSYRIATRPPMDYDSPIVETGFGPVPVNLIRQLSRGPAILLAVLALQLLLGSR